jgi:hypothetical protein
MLIKTAIPSAGEIEDSETADFETHASTNEETSL